MGVVNKLSGKQGGVACGSPAMMCCFCRLFFFSFLFVFEVASCMNVLLLHYVPYILHEIGQ